MTQLRIVVTATIRGHAPDLKAYAKHLARDVATALDNKDGPDLIVQDVEIERKLEGFESLLDRSPSLSSTDRARE